MVPDPPPSRDWAAFGVHFVFGAIFGAVIGLGIWARAGLEFIRSAESGAVCVAVCALAVGLLAGWGGQDFWKNIGR